MARTKKKAKKQEAEVNVRSLVAVKMTIHQWGGMSINSQAAREVEDNNRAESGTVKALLMLLPQRWQKRVASAACKLRGDWFKLSLPWEDGGWRVVPAANYEVLTKQAGELVAEYQAATDELLAAYPDILANAKTRLGDLYDEDKYPSPRELETMFGVRMFQRPIIGEDDVRIEGLSDGAVASVKASIHKQIGEQTREALQTLIGRLKELVEDALTRYAKDSQDRVRYKGLQKRVQKTCDALLLLNITGDEKVTDVIESVRASLTEHDPVLLRTDRKTQAKAKKGAKGVLKALDAFGV